MNEMLASGLVLLIALGAVAQWFAWRVGAPAILVLLLVGFVAGPLSGLLDPDVLLGPLFHPVISLGTAIVLFEGGLSASWKDLRSVARPVRRLVTFGLLFTWAGTTVAAAPLLDIPIELAVLLGAILVVTGPTVIGPLLRHAKPGGAVGRVLKLEGILNDPMGAVLAVLTFQVIEAEHAGQAVYHVLLGVAKTSLLASLMGVAAAWSFARLHERGGLPRHLESATLLPLVLAVYAGANLLQHESGLLAVTVMGICLASQDRVDTEASVEFAEHARTMLIPLLFVLLAARVTISSLTRLPWGTVAFAIVLVVVVRPFAVFLATPWSGLAWRERLFLAAVAPRGVVAAAVSSVFGLRLAEAGYERAELLMPVTFVVIAACVVVYGLGAAPLVRALDLREHTPNGVLLLGANHVARAIALGLRDAGVRVLLVDSEQSKVNAARAMGLETVHGRLLSENVLECIDLEGIGHFVALTENDDVNTLSAAHLRAVFGDGHVHQLHASGKGGRRPIRYATRLRASHFAGEKTFDDLSRLIHRGAEVRVVPAGELVASDADREARCGSIIPLFAISTQGRALRVVQREGLPQAEECVVSLVTDSPFEAGFGVAR